MNRAPLSRRAAAPTTRPDTTPITLDPAAVASAFGDLPTLAPVALEIVRLADDDRASLTDIAAVIARDPALAAQLLRVANSSVYGTARTTTSLTRATSILGLRTVKLLSLTFSVVTSPTSTDTTSALVWRHTLATSAMARTIATAHEPKLTDECLIAGLLTNLGRLALATYPAYHAAASATRTLLGANAERAAVGCTSDEVTAHLLTRWGLPDVLVNAAAHRTNPAGSHGAAARIARALHVADVAAQLIIADPQDGAEALERYRAAASEHLDLEEDEADALLSSAAPALEEIADMFSTNRPHDVALDQILTRAKDSLARLSLDTIAALEQEQSRTQRLAGEVERLAAEASTDTLTGLPNRRAYDEFLAQAIATHARRQRAGGIALLIFDVDHFKHINDTHGHDVGDDVLRELGARLAQHTRREEFAARIGGEEFAVVIPLAYRDELAPAAERFRSVIATTPFTTTAGPTRVTISVGGALLEAVDPGAARRIFKAADNALRAAKSTGRNRAITVTT